MDDDEGTRVEDASMPTTTMVDAPLTDADVAEESALEIVDCLRQFIDGLRDEFPACSIVGGGGIPSHSDDDDNNPHVDIPLYSRMEERGFVTTVKRVLDKHDHRKQKYQKPSSVSSSIRIGFEDNKDMDRNVKETVVEKGSHDDTSSSSSDVDPSEEDERERLLRTILLPLIRSLTDCYQILDALPQTPPPPSSISSSSSVPPREGRTKNNHKPSPPQGMLSIQQYTDIACLVEFTVWIGISSQLEDYVLMPPPPPAPSSRGGNRDRLQQYYYGGGSLPKSLAGRLPKASLLWWWRRKRSPPPASTSTTSADALLLEITTSLSRLLSLDRFRPMLLPRHAPTLYAALFQYEHNTTTTTTTLPQQNTNTSLWQTILPLGEEDDTLKARAYQSILQQGVKSPAWLRKRVGPLLTDLACTNLAAIVQVFVPLQQTHQQGEVSTMASQRLGRTLATAGSRLGGQIRVMLEAVFPTIDPQQSPPAQTQAILQTIWSILLQWPVDIVQQELIGHWKRGLQHDGDHVHRTLRQMGSLCASVPPPVTQPWKVLQFLIRPSIWSFLVRIASMSTTILASQAKEDARQVLSWLCQATATMLSSPDETKGGQQLPSGLPLLVSAWIEGIAFNSWDLEHSYHLVPYTADQGSVGQKKDTQLETIQICHVTDATTNGVSGISALMDNIQRRIDLFFHVCPMQNGPESLHNLPSMLFRLLLRIYLSSRSASADRVSWRHELVATILLPTLCDKCPQEDLLFGRHGGSSDTEDALGLLYSIRTILVCAMEQLKDNGESSLSSPPEADTGGESSNIASGDEFKMMSCLRLLQRDEYMLSMDTNHVLDRPLLQDEKEHDEALLSIASLVLSLLIALLELGSKRRSESEEATLQAFLPVLATLAGRCSLVSRSDMGGDSNGGISDMAGYALSLIASRKAQIYDSEPQRQGGTAAPTSPREKLEAIIREAEQDLASSQPPLRARGMVTLGRLARGYLGIVDLKQREQHLIVEWNEESKEDLVDLTIKEVLRLSMAALSDDESYVYLAAVQTIVAVGDLKPTTVLPQLATTVVTGSIAFNSEPLSLSNEQRIKLGEALMFIIRRRAAVEEFVPMLMGIMIFGSPNRVGMTSNCPDDQMQKLFAQETDKYFIGSSEDSIQEKKDQWEEQDTRVRTGGPLFDLEEDDIVRSMRISTVAELVCAAAPSSLAPFSRLLVRLVTDAMRLDSSRNVRRSAALLARELYGCLLREQASMHLRIQQNTNGTGQLRFAASLVSIKDQEDLMCVTLQDHACVSGNTTAVFDPATQSRCQEALDLRDEAELVMAAAKLWLAQQANAPNLPGLLTVMMQERPVIPEFDKMAI